MLLIARATKKDSETMSLIAIVTMVYLPGTFVAVSSLRSDVIHIILKAIDIIQH